METFLNVTLDLLVGFGTTFKLFALTLVFALPLGLLFSFCSMSKFKPISALMKIFIWIIRGTPLIIQTNVFVMYLRGLNFDIDPNDIIRPSGRENTSVNRKRSRVVSNPSSNFSVTAINPVPEPVADNRAVFIT